MHNSCKRARQGGRLLIFDEHFLKTQKFCEYTRYKHFCSLFNPVMLLCCLTYKFEVGFIQSLKRKKGQAVEQLCRLRFSGATAEARKGRLIHESNRGSFQQH